MQSTPSSTSSSTRYTPSSPSIAESNATQQNFADDLSSKLNGIKLEPRDDSVDSAKHTTAGGWTAYEAGNDLGFREGYAQGYDDGYEDGWNDR